jgi:hypothetical protein
MLQQIQNVRFGTQKPPKTSSPRRTSMEADLWKPGLPWPVGPAQLAFGLNVYIDVHPSRMVAPFSDCPIPASGLRCDIQRRGAREYRDVTEAFRDPFIGEWRGTLTTLFTWYERSDFLRRIDRKAAHDILKAKWRCKTGLPEELSCWK